MKYTLLLISFLFSCGMVDNESATDEKFVGMWQVYSMDMPGIDSKASVGLYAQSLCALEKVPKTREAYIFVMPFFGDLSGLIFKKKDANTLVYDLGTVEGVNFLYSLKYNTSTKRLVYSAGDAKQKMTVEFTKVK